MNCGTFQGRPASDFKESIFVLETLFPIAFGNIQWNRLRRTQPLVTSLTIRPAERFSDLIRECHLSDRQSMNIESFMIESRFCHHDPFEYEYRCTEYEYDCLDELLFMPGAIDKRTVCR